MDVGLQSLPPKHGLGRVHTDAATGHGSLAPLLTPAEDGTITGVFVMKLESAEPAINLPSNWANGMPIWEMSVNDGRPPWENSAWP